MSELDEAIRFAEEYGYNNWQAARDEANAARREIKELKAWLEKQYDRITELEAALRE